MYIQSNKLEKKIRNDNVIGFLSEEAKEKKS